MRVTKVEPIPLLARLPEGMKAPVSIPHADRLAGTVFKGYRACLVRIHTDEEVTGVGECMVRLAPEATAAIVAELGEVLVGHDPLDTMVAWELMFSVNGQPRPSQGLLYGSHERRRHRVVGP